MSRLPPGLPQCWLVRENGAAVRVTARGIILGRRPDCDVVLDEPTASATHVMVTPTLDGIELLALGRNPTLVNGEPVQTRTVLSDGDVIELPGGRFSVRVHEAAGWSARAWWIGHPDGHRYALRQVPFSVGGSGRDNLRVQGWPASLLVFYAAGGALAVELTDDAVLNDTPIERGAVEVLEGWDRIEYGDQAIDLRAADPDDRAHTVLSRKYEGALSVRFRFLPAGGRFWVDVGSGSVEVDLSELRANLIAALLQPPGAYNPGDAIPDEVLIPAIWPGRTERGRTDLNVLIHRTRKDLLKAGLNPAAVLERARRGGSTRIRLAPGAGVSVE